MLKEDSQKMRAKDLHELLRAWENYHRILTAEAHMKHIQFREEKPFPGFYYRTDKNFVPAAAAAQPAPAQAPGKRR